MTSPFRHFPPKGYNGFRFIYRRAVATGLCVGILVGISACSSPGAPPKAQTAAQAINLAAARLQQTRSLTVSLTSQNPGAGGTVTATVREQLSPVTLLEGNILASFGSGSLQTLAFLTGTAAYLRSSTLDMWARISLPDLFKQKLGNDIYPLVMADPLYQASVLAAATGTREEGRQPVDGVETTLYSGSYRPAAALARLSSTAAEVLGPSLRALTRDVSFDIWIDARHQIRKIRLIETAKNDTVTTTLILTAINQTVGVAVPSGKDSFNEG